MLGGDAEHGGMYDEGMRDGRHWTSRLQLVREAVHCPLANRGCYGLVCQRGRVSR